MRAGERFRFERTRLKKRSSLCYRRGLPPFAKNAKDGAPTVWLCRRTVGPAPTTSYYEQDGLGSVTSLSNGSGALAKTYTFDSYGKLTASTGTLTNPFQFTGREINPETQLYFYRSRYYDNSAGRFIPEDPTGFDGGND